MAPSTIQVLVPLAEGFEEVEATTVVDLLRRARISVTLASIGDCDLVFGAHGICLKADCLLQEVRTESLDAVVLPGGMPGTRNLLENQEVGRILQDVFEKGKYLAAICAAPIVLGKLGILSGRRATCYPGFEKELEGALISPSPVVEDGKIITACGPGAAIPFSLALIKRLAGPEVSLEVSKSILSQN